MTEILDKPLYYLPKKVNCEQHCDDMYRPKHCSVHHLKAAD